MELQGKKMAVLGDSITEGVGVANIENMYYNRIKKVCGLRTLYVDGISGTRLARQQEPTYDPRADFDFISRVDKIEDDCDVVVIFGGTNDFGHGDAPLGTPKDHTPDTFWGACSVLFEKLMTRFPKAQIVCMGPLHRWNEDNPCGDRKPKPVATLYEYADILQCVTKRYSIPYLDMLQVGGMTPKVEVNREMYMPDGLHPNDAGHALIAARLKGFLGTL